MSFSNAKQIVITLAACIWVPALNVRRAFDTVNKVFTKEPAVFNPEDPDTRALIESFRDRGYDPQYPCVVGPITAEQVKDAVTERTNQWLALQNALKLSGSPENAARLAAFEFFYTEEVKGGKRTIVKPENLGCTGNRRSACIFEAAVQRLLLTLKGGNELFPKDVEINKHPEKVLKGLDIYALFEQFKDDDARHIRQIAENTAKTEGFKELSPIEVLLQLRDGVETGRINQNAIRNMYKAGTGQKMYGILMLNGRFPKLRILERLMLPAANADHIPWVKLPQGGGEDGLKMGFPTVLRRTNRIDLDAWNDKMRKEDPNKVKTLMTEADVETQLQVWKKGEAGNEQKMMEKSMIKTIQSASAVKIVRDLFEDVLLNEKKTLDRLTAVAPTFNALDSLIGTECFNGVNGLLLAIEGTEDKSRKALVERMIAATVEPKVEPKTVKAAK